VNTKLTTLIKKFRAQKFPNYSTRLAALGSAYSKIYTSRAILNVLYFTVMVKFDEQTGQTCLSPGWMKRI
jgi:hypothetical protein